MPPQATIDFLRDRAASPAAFRAGMPLEAWPGVTRRALSDAEREWLEQLEALPCPLWVQYEGLRMPYERGYLYQRVQDALERGKGHVERDAAGQLVATLPNGRHTILHPGTGESAAGCGSAPQPVIRDRAAGASLLLGAASSEAAVTGGSGEAGASGNQAPGSSPPPPRQPLSGAAARGSHFLGSIPREGCHAGRGCKDD